MTEIQKAVIRELFDNSYDSGFGSYPLSPIIKKLKIKKTVFDTNTNTGILWDISQYGKGFVDIKENNNELYASISFDLKEPLEHWSDYKSYGR